MFFGTGLSLIQAAARSVGEGGGGGGYEAQAIRVNGPDASLRIASFDPPDGNGTDLTFHTVIRPDAGQFGQLFVVDPDGNYATDAYFSNDGSGVVEVGNGDASSGIHLNFPADTIQFDQWNSLTWSVGIRSMPPTLEAGLVAVSPDGNGMYATQTGSSPAAWYSTDAGASWTGADPEAEVNAITPLDLSWATGGLIAATSSGSFDNVVKSVDGGVIWTAVGFDTPSTGLDGVAASSDVQTIVAVRDDNVFVTTNGGTGWSVSLNVVDAGFTDCFISADGTYMVVLDSANSKVQWSDDTGETWHEVSVETSPDAMCASSDCQTLYLSAGTEFLYKSWNGGVNWTSGVDVGVSSIAHHVCSSNGSIVYVLGKNGAGSGPFILRKSTNSGLSWSAVAFEDDATVPNFTAVANMSLACSADGATVLLHYTHLWRSTNGGTTWAKVGDYSLVALRVNGEDVDLSASISAIGTFPFNIAMNGLPVYFFDDGFSDGFQGAVSTTRMWPICAIDPETGFIAADFEPFLIDGNDKPRNPTIGNNVIGDPLVQFDGDAAAFAVNGGTAGAVAVVGTFEDADWAEPVIIGEEYEAPDETGPVLTGAFINATSSTTANIAVTTDTIESSLLWVVVADGLQSGITYEQVAAGFDNNGDPADASGYVTPVEGETGASAAGLTPGTTYWVVWVQSDNAANHSNVLISADPAMT